MTHKSLLSSILASLVCAAGCSTTSAGPALYDEKADARQQVTAAVAQASRAGKNVVLVFGANW